jgi:hypothetical protein
MIIGIGDWCFRLPSSSFFFFFFSLLARLFDDTTM